MEVKAFVNGCQVIHSGIIHMVGRKAEINVEGLPININFLDDGMSQRWGLEGHGKSVDLNLFNISGSLPEGVVEPIEIARSPSGIFYITFLTALMDKSKQFRSFEYTILFKEQLNG
ncbi:DUF6864 domain-containing function [Pseudomonas sp. XP1]